MRGVWAALFLLGGLCAIAFVAAIGARLVKWFWNLGSGKRDK